MQTLHAQSQHHVQTTYCIICNFQITLNQQYPQWSKWKYGGEKTAISGLGPVWVILHPDLLN